MKRTRLLLLLFFFGLVPRLAPACAVCFGAPGSQDTEALTVAIASLLGVLGVVLGGIVALMICLAKRSRQAVSEEGFPETGPASPEPILDRC